MTAKEIKKALIDLDIKQTDIAKQLGISKATVNNVIHGRAKSSRVMKYIKTLVLKHNKAA